MKEMTLTTTMMMTSPASFFSRAHAHRSSSAATTSTATTTTSFASPSSSSSLASSSTTTRTKTAGTEKKRRGDVVFRVRATDGDKDEGMSDGNSTNDDGKFKRAPGEDQEKFQKSVADSPFSRKKIQPLPSKFGVSDRAAGAKQNLPFNQITDRAGKDGPISPSSNESSSFAAAAAARSPFDNVSPPKSTSPKSPFASSSSAASTSRPSSPFASSSSATNASASPMAPTKPATKAKNPFNEPDAATYGTKPMKVDKPKEVKFEIPEVTFAQIFIVLSFTTIIGLMIGTFWVVWNSGGIRFNET